MFTTIEVIHPAFGRSPLVLDELSTITYIYGSNGSGKTTLARTLGGSSGDSSRVRLYPDNEVDFRVFNRDYIDNTIISKPGLKGVFTLVEDAARLQDRHDELTRKIAGVRASILESEEKERAAERSVSAARAEIGEVAW